MDWSTDSVNDFQSWWLDDNTDAEESSPEVWAGVAQYARNAVVVAHLSDLLWTIRYPVHHLHARRAVEAYLQSAGLLTEPHDATRALLRAHALARSLNDSVLVDRVQQVLIDSARSSLTNEDLGLTLTILEDLSESMPLRADTQQYEELLDRVWAAVARPDHVQRAGKLLLRRTADVDYRLTIATRVLETHLASARGRDGLGRLVGLRETLRVAEELGHPWHDEILSEIESFDSTGAFEPIRSEFVVPRGYVSDFCAHIVGSDSLDNALMRFALELPTTPNTVSNVRSNTRIGIRHTMTSHLVGEANSVVTSNEPTAGEEDPLVAAVQRDVLQMVGYQAQLTAFMLLVPALHQILDSYHPWSTSDVQASLVAGTADEIVAHALARGLEHFRNKRYDEAVHVTLPRVERLIRHIARSCGIATTKRPTKRVGGIRGLGEILSDLRGDPDEEPRLPEPLLTACELTLVDPDALNLRNEILHGISEEVRPGDAALILQLGLALILTIRLNPVAPSGTG